jgi:hypothetical protein
MFAATGAELPASVDTNSPEEVAAAVVKAIRTNAAEVDVAAPLMRLGGRLGSLTPALVAAIARRQGAERIRRAMADARRSARP